MEVYIEYVLLDNMAFDFVLLKSALLGKTVRTNTKMQLLSAAVGTVITVIMPLITVPDFAAFFMKLILAAIMVAIGGRYADLKCYFLRLNIFVLLTFLYGGAIFGILTLIGVDYNYLYNTADSILPLGGFIVAAFLLYRVSYKTFDILFEKRRIYPFVRRCVLYNNGQSICVIGFVDSGNGITYKREGVLVASKRLSAKMYLSGFLDDCLTDVVHVKTINGESAMNIYEIDKIEIYSVNEHNIIYKPIIGISARENFGGEYDLILSASACAADKTAA